MTFAIEAIDIRLRFTFKRRASKCLASKKVFEINGPGGKLILVLVRIILTKTEIKLDISIAL